MSEREQPAEMPPGFTELWENVTHSRMDVAELKGMIRMHFKDGVHHTPPCATAEGLQKTLRAATGAAILSLLSAVGCLVLELVRCWHG
jgi:hypothetical protein